MPSELQEALTGRCYCGAVHLTLPAQPLTVAYCHCADCRRWTGGAVGAIATFDAKDLQTTPDLGVPFSCNPGVERWNCPDCGSPLAARFDYLPGQIYVPLGVLDQAADLPPHIHCHADARLPWLHIKDDLPHAEASGRAALNHVGNQQAGD